MTLEYFSGDFARTGTNIYSGIAGVTPDNFNGNISAETWRTVEQGADIMVAGYSYDDHS